MIHHHIKAAESLDHVHAGDVVGKGVKLAVLQRGPVAERLGLVRLLDFRVLELVIDEMVAGKDRAAAFAGLASRTKIPDLHALASALELGSRLGFPVADILSVQAEIQREKRVERGRKRIDRAVIIALFPVLLCGLPILFIVVVLPVILELLKTIDLVKFLFH